MISEESFRLFSYLIRVGCRTWCLPYRWNPVNCTVHVVPYLRLWRVWCALYTITDWCLLTSIIVPLYYNPSATEDPVTQIKSDDYIYVVFTGTAIFLSQGIRFYNFFHPHEFAALMSSIHLLARKLSVHHRIPLQTRDGVELLSKVALISFVCMVLGNWIGNTAMIQDGKPLFSLLRSEYVVLNIGLGLVWGNAVMNTFGTAGLFVLIALNYANGMAGFLNRLKFSPESDHRRIHILFRAHQVLHERLAQFARNIVATTFGASCALQITGFYTMSRFKTQDPVMTATIIISPIVLLIATKIVLDFAMVYTDASCVYPDSFTAWTKKALLRRRTRNGGDDSKSDDEDKDPHPKLTLYKALYRQFATYRPLRFRIGIFFYVRKVTFVIVEFTVVFQNVVNLFLAFK